MTTADRKVVYIAEAGCYSDRYVIGIFDTPERAMAACHDGGSRTRWTRRLWHFKSDPALRGGGFEEWTNNRDWQSHVAIRAMEVDDDGPERRPDRIEELYDGPEKMICRELTAEEADQIVRA